MENGEFRVVVIGIDHWCRAAGAANQTVPLVVVHGGPGGNLYNFERTVGPLLEEFATVLYYEQRGCGRSGPPGSPGAYSLDLLVADLEALRRHLGLPRVALLGFSFGGELALAYALAHPGRVERLILQAPSVSDPERAALVQLNGFHTVATGVLKEQIAALLGADAPTERRLEEVWALVDRETVDRFLFCSPAAAALNRRLWHESGLVNTGDMRRALTARPKTPLDPSRIAVPTLVLVGLHDRNVGVDACRDLSARVAGAELVVFEESAHFPDIEEPARYVSVVRQFLLGT